MWTDPNKKADLDDDELSDTALNDKRKNSQDTNEDAKSEEEEGVSDGNAGFNDDAGT